jgi:predicted ArsR family transcriptional regulator
VQPPSGGPIVLRNCPFDALARDYRELVCVMNLSLVSGLVAGLRRSGLEAVFEPQPGRCCVVLASA